MGWSTRSPQVTFLSSVGHIQYQRVSIDICSEKGDNTFRFTFVIYLCSCCTSLIAKERCWELNLKDVICIRHAISDSMSCRRERPFRKACNHTNVNKMLSESSNAKMWMNSYFETCKEKVLVIEDLSFYYQILWSATQTSWTWRMRKNWISMVWLMFMP